MTVCPVWLPSEHMPVASPEKRFTLVKLSDTLELMASNTRAAGRMAFARGSRRNQRNARSLPGLVIAAGRP